jgi:hypothetical protein
MGELETTGASASMSPAGFTELTEIRNSTQPAPVLLDAFRTDRSPSRDLPEG